MWWIISNSNTKYSNNVLVPAAVAGDNKSAFLRHFARLIEEWQCTKLCNGGRLQSEMKSLVQDNLNLWNSSRRLCY